MSLILTAQQESLRLRAREFAEAEVRPRVREMVESNAFQRDLYRRCGELGFWRLNVPVEHGGDGKGLTEASIVLHELARVSPALALSVEIGMVSLPLLVTAPARKYAEDVMNGAIVIAAGSSDPSGQNNSAEWDVFAREDGDDYVLNGTRLYVTNAEACDLFSVSGLDENRRMMKFYVRKSECRGFETLGADLKHGMAGTGGGTITLTDCRVPKEMTAAFAIGTSPYYYYYYYVYCLCVAQALGCMEGIFEQTCGYLSSRTSGFAPLVDLQSVSHKLAAMRLQIEMARSLVYDATTMYDEALADGGPESLDAWSLKAEAAKICVSRIAAEVTTECMILHGGRGYHDPELHHYVGDALTYRIMDMTNEIHLDNVARLMGLTAG